MHVIRKLFILRYYIMRWKGILFCKEKVITFCVENFITFASILLHFAAILLTFNFALVLQFAAIITFCGVDHLF